MPFWQCPFGKPLYQLVLSYFLPWVEKIQLNHWTKWVVRTVAGGEVLSWLLYRAYWNKEKLSQSHLLGCYNTQSTATADWQGQGYWLVLTPNINNAIDMLSQMVKFCPVDVCLFVCCQSRHTANPLKKLRMHTNGEFDFGFCWLSRHTSNPPGWNLGTNMCGAQ